MVEIDTIGNFSTSKEEFVKKLTINKNDNVCTIDEKRINTKEKALAVCVSITAEMD